MGQISSGLTFGVVREATIVSARAASWSQHLFTSLRAARNVNADIGRLAHEVERCRAGQLL